MGDIGTHAHNLTRFITGLELAEVAAETGTILPGRLNHDFAGALLRFENGARGSFWVTQAAAGWKIACAFASAGPKAVWNGCRNFPRR
jgi:predicted dehydrogenase